MRMPVTVSRKRPRIVLIMFAVLIGPVCSAILAELPGRSAPTDAM
jgi:hypothetical protein